MYLSYLDVFDLLLRVFTVGQLSAVSLYVLSKKIDLKSILAVLMSVCFSAYIILTAPVPDEHYGILRGILLFFTEFAPYVLWSFALSLLKDDFTPQKWSLWIKATITLFFLSFVYFFGFLQGKGAFHQVNHAFQLIPLLHIIYIAIKGLTDDLVNARRNVRMLLVMAISIYFIFILVLELGDSSLRASSVFSSLNASMILLATSIFSWYLFNNTFKDETPIFTDEAEQGETESRIPLVYRDVHNNLCQLMNDGFFKELQLSISELANKLSIPEHQLRELINKHLGFRNFSDFLNSYRLPAACAQLEDNTNIRKPILTIALELGYGSIGTFNRAFKAKTGKTPKEYRSQFQK